MTVCQPFTHEHWKNELEPSDIVSAAKRDLNTLLRLYHYRHGFQGADSWLTAPLTKLGFMSLQNINDEPFPCTEMTPRTKPQLLHLEDGSSHHQKSGSV